MYNIFRTYTMCIAVDILCAGVMSTVLEETELVILPGTGDYGSPLPGSAQGFFEVLNLSRLPSYVEAVSQMGRGLLSIREE
jgi:hypothetical protein